jgi:hypothetical protein
MYRDTILNILLMWDTLLLAIRDSTLPLEFF